MTEQLQAKEFAKHLSWKNLDISLSVCITETSTVCDAVKKIFNDLFPGQESEFTIIETMFEDIDRMYHGIFPGYNACDTNYHDIRHILDVTLAAVRLFDGYEKVHGQTDKSLGLVRIQQGITGALFHDIGYLRHRNDTKHKHGAEYTKIHVTRGTQFLATYLPTKGKESWVPKMKQLLHYTGYEKRVTMIDPLDHMLGCLLGTADLIAQMSDRVYLERCRDFLYEEFRIGEITSPTGNLGLPFESPLALLDQTHNFIHTTIDKRLDEMFGSVYLYAADHFGGDNLYMDGIKKNCSFLESLLKEHKLHQLNRNSS